MTKILLTLLLCFCIMNVYAQNVSNDEIIATVMESAEPELVQQVTSPDGSTRIEITAYPCVPVDEISYSFEQLHIIENETNEANLMSEMLISCSGLGAAGFWVQHWDGSYVYYHSERQGVPDGAGYWTPRIQRAELSGIQILNIYDLGSAKFSPDKQWLAAWDTDHIGIMTVDNTDTIEFELTPDDMMLSDVVWLPDNSGLLYVQSDAPFMSTQSSVTHIDIMTMEQTVLLDNR